MELLAKSMAAGRRLKCPARAQTYSAASALTNDNKRTNRATIIPLGDKNPANIQRLDTHRGAEYKGAALPPDTSEMP